MIHTSAPCIKFLGNKEVQFEGVFWSVKNTI